MKRQEKLNDADLIGIPLRIIISRRTQTKSVEWNTERKRQKVVRNDRIINEINEWIITNNQ